MWLLVVGGLSGRPSGQPVSGSSLPATDPHGLLALLRVRSLALDLSGLSCLLSAGMRSNLVLCGPLGKWFSTCRVSTALKSLRSINQTTVNSFILGGWRVAEAFYFRDRGYRIMHKTSKPINPKLETLNWAAARQVLRMDQVDPTTLAMGTDLTTLGLNLNSPEQLYKSFASPWAERPLDPDPDFKVPCQPSLSLSANRSNRPVISCHRSSHGALQAVFWFLPSLC